MLDFCEKCSSLIFPTAAVPPLIGELRYPRVSVVQKLGKALHKVMHVLCFTIN